jgi:PAS domain S-box-containing protein
MTILLVGVGGGAVVGLLLGLALRRRYGPDAEAFRQFHAAFEAASDGLALADAEGRLLLVNESLERLLGRSNAQLRGTPLRLYIEEADRSAYAEMMRLLRSGSSGALAFQGRCRGGGGAVSVSMNARAYRAGGALCFVVFALQDLTETETARRDRDRLEAQFYQAQKLEALGQVAAGVAHDFNNRLGIIIGSASLLRDRGGLANRGGRLVEKILAASQQAADLTRQLLAFSRKGDFETQSVDLHCVIRDVGRLLEHSVDKRVRIGQDLQAASASVEGDPALLQNLLFNLAVNACDAMPEGGDLTFRTRLGELPEGVGEGPALCVEVRDTGEGIDPAVRQRIFEPFFTTKERGRGTGLGLAAVDGTVRRHGGIVEVASTPGEGTVFTVYLPSAAACRLARSAPAGVAVPAPAPTPTDLRGSGRILIIDDEEEVGDIAADVLAVSGYECLVVTDPDAAIERYRQEAGDVQLVLLDMNMPRLSGREVFRRLREIDPGVRVLVVTGYAGHAEIDDLLAEGAMGVVTKPFDIHALTHRVAEALPACAS